MLTERRVDLIIYGDFNCPFSALASFRAECLERAGVVRVDWRAVEHDPDVPGGGEPVRGSLVAELDRELEQVHGLLLSCEHLELRRPRLRSNTAAAVEIYAGAEPRFRAAMRAELFRRFWVAGEDLGDDGVLDAVGINRATDTALRWRREWFELGSTVVPTMRLSDGYVSRGLGALSRLADLLDR